MNMTDPYEGIAPFYDLEFDSFTADHELYMGYAAIVGGPILELGCGTGRLSIPLARAGYQVVGIDNSPSMIEIARQHISTEISKQIELIVDDMRELTQVRSLSFRLIFSSINSFLHLSTRQDQLNALDTIRSRLDRDGLLILDLFHPTPDALSRMDDRYDFDGSWVAGDGDRIERFSYRHLDVSEQTIRTTLFYDLISPSGSVSRKTTAYDTRYIHRFEMESLLAESGFELEGVYGSYALDPLENDSEHMIFVAHRTPWPGEE